LSDMQVALFISVVFLGEFAGSILFGSIADKYGRRRTFIFGRLLY
jgi:MFS family permease